MQAKSHPAQLSRRQGLALAELLYNQSLTVEITTRQSMENNQNNMVMTTPVLTAVLYIALIVHGTVVMDLELQYSKET